MFVLEYNCQKESGFMSKIFENKFLMGVTVIFLISLYVIAGIQTNIETKTVIFILIVKRKIKNKTKLTPSIIKIEITSIK